MPASENPPSQARISSATAHESDQQKVPSSTAFTPAYAGDITPEQAWKLLSENPEAVLVDVRTDAEWRFVGAPDLASLGREVVYIEWNSVDGKRNENFVAELSEQVPAHTDRPVVFLCRSGNRSIGAAEAATEAGSRRPTTCSTVSKGISTATVTAAGAAGGRSGCPGSRHD